MAEHKHCECGGCYGYHYPSCDKRIEGVDYDTIAEKQAKRILELEWVVEHHKNQYRDMLKPWIERVERRDATITRVNAQLAEKELQVDKLAGWYSESQGQIAGLKRVVERIKLMAMGWHNQENYIAVTELIEQELAKAKEGS